MKSRPPLPAGPFQVVGLARSGVAAALALHARGEQVIATDSGRPTEAAGRLSQAGVEVRLDDSGQALAAGARTLVKSPGVPHDAPVVRAAKQHGLTVIGELELAWRLLANEFIAVTGTNGKTTTVEWIGHIHREAGLPVRVAGNVGTALSSLIGEISIESTIVCEASSFQLEDTLAFAPEAAALLNLAPDHLDRHGTFDAYVAAKLRIFANQGNDDIAVAPEGLGIEDLGGCARRVCFGPSPEAEFSDHSGMLWWDDQPLLRHDELGIPGEHNRANAMAAAALCLARGVEPAAVRTGLQTFTGVAHRLERIAVIDDVDYVNDSKATNVASTLVALKTYNAPVHLILGGRGKQQDFSPLRDAIARHCRSVLLIGEATGELMDVLAGSPAELVDAGDMEHAVAGARDRSRAGDVVLLSPACASFDQYENFETRGEDFRRIVQALR